MTADVEQNDFLFGNVQGQSDAIAGGETDGMATGKLAGQGVEFEMGLKRVALQVGQHLGEARLQLGMFLEEFTRLPQKLLRPGVVGQKKDRQIAQVGEVTDLMAGGDVPAKDVLEIILQQQFPVDFFSASTTQSNPIFSCSRRTRSPSRLRRRSSYK
ncbi:MAG TPA: hypothetical protein VGA63_09890, partial [Geopsychrobacteraceae bacterium]